MSNALLEAIQTRDVERLAALLATGADPNEIGKSRRGKDILPLLAAIWELEDFSEDDPGEPEPAGPIELVVLLLRYGAKVNGWDVNKDGDPLLTAVLMNNIDAARLLLAQGADPNVCDNAGTAPLRWCAENGYLEMARLLLLCGATQTIHEGAGPTGMNALGFAATRLNVDMVRLLLAHGADPRIEDVDDMTTFRILQCAIENGRIPEDPASQECLQEIRKLLGDPSA
jgi:ankyrin repeat protein